MVPEGPESIVVSGGVVSTVKVLVAGVGSWFPAASSALNSAVWGPSVRPVKVFGLAQSVKGSESIWHWILAVSPAGSPLKVKVAWSVVMVPEGPESIVVSGGVVSTVKVLVAGVGSWFPAASSALNSAVWGPSVRPVKVFGDGAVGEGLGVDPALDLGGVGCRVSAEGEGGLVGCDGAGGAGVDRGVGRSCVDGEGAGGRGRVLVSGCVFCSELRGVGAVCEAGEGLWAGAVGEGLGVDPAVDLGCVAGRVSAEGEGGLISCDGAGGAGVDRGIGRSCIGGQRGVNARRIGARADSERIGRAETWLAFVELATDKAGIAAVESDPEVATGNSPDQVDTVGVSGRNAHQVAVVVIGLDAHALQRV